MNREERQLYNFIDKFKHHIQSHLQFSPMALSNFHHFSDRLLDKRDGNFEAFKKNTKEMVKGSEPISVHGYSILEKLQFFVSKGKDINDFINIVYWIYEER